MEKSEAILEAIRQIGRTPEEQAIHAYKAFVSADYTFYKELEKEKGSEEARELHKKLWVRYVPAIVREVKEAMSIGEVTDLSTVGRIVRYAFDFMSCPMKVIDDLPHRFTGIILLCPMVDYSIELFGLELGCPYHHSLSQASLAYAEEIVKFLGLRPMIEVSQDKSICLGDDFCRITLTRKGKL
jgi:hypothetical protein